MNKRMTWVYFALFAIIIEIPFLNRFSYIATIQTVLQIIAIPVVAIINFKKFKISKFFLCEMLFLLVYLMSTLINSGDIKKCSAEVVSIVVLSLIIERGIRGTKTNFVKGAYLFFITITLINLITLIIYRDGLYETASIQYTTSLNWFLGYKNLHILYLIQLIFWGACYDYLIKKKISFCALIAGVISVLTAYLAGSTTSLIGSSLITILLFFIKNNNDNNKQNNRQTISKTILLYLSLEISIVFFRLQEKFESLIFQMTGKHSDLVGRTYIWDSVIKMIGKKPMLGYGREETLARMNKTEIWKAVHAHNGLLEIIYRCGAVGFCLFLLLFYLSAKELNKYNNVLTKAFIVIIAVTSIMTISEYYDLLFVLPLLVVAYNIKYLISNEKENSPKLA